MQPENRHLGDEGPNIPPSSPTLSTFRHAPPFDNASPAPRRSPQAQPQDLPSQHGSTSSSSMSDGVGQSFVRIAIVTPFSDVGSARRKEGCSVDPSWKVADLKDALASGTWAGGEDGERWERTGMRVVWQGRIVRDEETIGDITGKGVKDPHQLHTFHLVARRIAGPSRPVLSRAPSAVRSHVVPPQNSLPVPANHSTMPGRARRSQALVDTIHYLLFMARYHLCRLTDVVPLEWHDTVPPPTIEHSVAKEAIMSVVATYAEQFQDRQEGWEDWQKVFTEEGDLSTTERSDLEAEVRSLWVQATGRTWKDGSEGETALVEMDGNEYHLALPPLHLLARRQLVQLTLYLRITHFLPLINPLLTEALASSQRAAMAEAFANTRRLMQSTLPTTTAPRPWPQAQAPRRPIRRLQFRLRLNMDDMMRFFFMTCQMTFMLWLFCRDMKWNDYRLWVLCGGAGGYWMGQVIIRLRQCFSWTDERGVGLPQGDSVRGQQPVNAVPGNQQPPNAPQQRPQAQQRPAAQQQRRANGANGSVPRNRQSLTRYNILTRILPHLHLDVDSDHLHLSQLNANARWPRRSPSVWVRRILLPIALWLVTLVPEWEALRSRAIRNREREMRVWVGELSKEAAEASRVAAEQAKAAAGASESEATEAGARKDPKVGRSTNVGTSPNSHESTGSMETGADATGNSEQEPPSILPDGLLPEARRYYLRVIAKGEGIDWEEEREAQRAMGVEN